MIFPSIAENSENMIFTLNVFPKMLFFMQCCYLQLFNCNVFFHYLRYEKMFCEIDESLASQHDPSIDVIFLGGHCESIFFFIEYFFFSRKLCFIWSPCSLLIAESVSLDTSGKPTVGFF